MMEARVDLVLGREQASSYDARPLSEQKEIKFNPTNQTGTRTDGDGRGQTGETTNGG
jgi:hypothetical protein